MKKIPTIAIVMVFLMFFIIITYYFWGFKEWEKTPWATLAMLSILNTLGICIVVIFVLLKLLKFICPKLNKYFANDTKNYLTYIIMSCILLTLAIPFLIFKISFTGFLLRYSITSFIYLFGVVTICNKIFDL